MKTTIRTAQANGTSRSRGLPIRNLIQQAKLLIARAGTDDGYFVPARGGAAGAFAFLVAVLLLLLREHVIK